MNHVPDPSCTEARQWATILAQSRADAVAGRVHELEDVLADIQRDIGDLEQEAQDRIGAAANSI